ncbi:Helix-turn-helix domain-containing protein [Bacteroidales bacterium WCE2004]|nr:Helix-turn-helix domain-containing protein [Bacteroidales bacterium WCE2004]
MINVEENLREICRRKGLRLSDVADRVGAGQSNLINSVKGNPKLSTLQDIADALNISVSELLTMRPEAAAGIVIIDGQTYQLSKPAAATVQLPSFTHYDTLREEIKVFIKKCVDGSEPASKMGIVETLEVFSLIYDPAASKFFLSLCYADGKTLTNIYDKFEFCDWKEGDSEEDAIWDLADVTEEIINDIEGWVPSKLQTK